MSLPCPCASRSRKSTAARVQASARSLSRRTVSGGFRLAGEIGQRDQEMRLALSVGAAPSSGSLSETASVAAALGDLGSDRSQPRLDRLDRKAHRGSAGARRAVSRRNGDRSNTAARKSWTAPLPARNFASRASPSSCGRGQRSRPVPRRARLRSSGTSLAAGCQQPAGFDAVSQPPSPSSVLLPSGKTHDHGQSRIAGQKIKPAAVELHDRLGEAQAEAGTRLRAALLQPHETLGRALRGRPRPECPGRCRRRQAGFRRLSRSSVTRTVGLSRRVGRIFDRVVDDVGQRLADQLAVAVDGEGILRPTASSVDAQPPPRPARRVRRRRAPAAARSTRLVLSAE